MRAAGAKGNCHHEFATLPIYFRRSTAGRQPGEKKTSDMQGEIFCAECARRLKLIPFQTLRLPTATNQCRVKNFRQRIAK